MAAAKALIKKYPTFDMHTHSGWVHLPWGHLKLTMQGIAKGGLTGFGFSLVSDRGTIKRTDKNVGAFREPNPDELYDGLYRQLALARNHFKKHGLVEFQKPNDIRAAKAKGGHGVLIASEGGDFLEGRLGRVEEAYRRGIRSIGLAHQRVNRLADILNAEPRHGGLTKFGRDVIREMNRLGMIVDLAHLTWEATRAAVKVTDKPVMFSHASPRGLVPITDDHARAVAETGGIIGAHPGGMHEIEDYLDWYVRLADLVGVEHVGLGSDIDASRNWRAFDNFGKLPALAAGLLGKGFSPKEVVGLLGGNFLRLFEAVSVTKP
ncbi:MAG: membrane dipeptidase [Desulfarculaceae bacterium]